MTLRSILLLGLTALATVASAAQRPNIVVILADDMGLGKTVQVIAFLLLLKEKNYASTHLLVVPTSLLFNWLVELERFAPTLKCLTLHGSNRSKNTDIFEQYDIILTSYGTLLTDITYLRRFQFGYLLLDTTRTVIVPLCALFLLSFS